MSGENRLPVLAVEIRRAHADVQDAAKTAAQRAIDAGHALIEAKALLKHGTWLPWLRENCALSQRAAQLYMKIAKLGLESATVADLGLNAAAKVITLQYPDPFNEDDDQTLCEWRLYVLFQMRDGRRSTDAGHFCEWLRRNGWCSPSEWYGHDGDRYRTQLGLRPVPEKHRSAWFDFLDENRDRSAADVAQEVERLASEEPPQEPVKPKRRRRRKKLV